MNSKQKIARLLVVFGFILSMVNYGLDLVSFYTDNEFAFVMEEAEENSESSENEETEMEDLKETNKISQLYTNRIFEASTIHIHSYPERKFYGISVFLEYTTPPPEKLFRLLS